MLHAEGIVKAFGATRANADVNFEVARGEIVGLLGENGAGKSTLLAILAGYLKPDAGRITMAGRTVAFDSPADAIHAGVGLVHQHLSLVPSFTLREQMKLAGWISPDMPEIISSLDPDIVIERLSLGERQRIEIAKAMVPKPSLLLLDEPTTILAPGEVQGLFETLRDLRAAGTSVVIVTHKLGEVLDIADRVVVMARGRVQGAFTRDEEGQWPEQAKSQMLTAMFGLQAEDVAAVAGADRRGKSQDASRPLLTLDKVSSPTGSEGREVRRVSFDLEEGKLHTVVGIDGSGQRELATIIAGYRTARGTVSFLGDDVSGTTALDRAAMGIRLLVDDRLGEAAIGSFTIAENLILKRPRPGWITSLGMLRRGAIREHATETIEAWDVQPANPDAPFGTLSGGNMQRVLAARELTGTTRFLVALNPMQGLDVRTEGMLWQRLRTLCDSGGAVLVFTTDMDEAFNHGDTIAVIAEGRVSPFKRMGEADRREIASMMVNGW